MNMRVFRFVAVMVAAGAVGCEMPVEPLPEEVQPDERRWWRNYKPTATVYVVHGINGQDLGLAEALPVDISLNGECAIEGFEFRTITDAIRLPVGTYDIAVHLADATPCGGAAPIVVPGAKLTRNQNVSIVAHLDESGAPTASIFPNDRYVRRFNRNTKVFARHTANFSAVDVLANGGVVFEDLENGNQNTVVVPPGEYTLAINAANTDIEAFSATLDLKRRRGYVLYAVGTPGSTFEVLVQELHLRPWIFRRIFNWRRR